MESKKGKKTLYFHIGKFKTGSTSIQNFLYLNREVLESRGVCYPDISGSQVKRFINGRSLFRFLSNGNMNKAKKLIQKAVKEANAQSCSNILISNECFSRRAVMQNPDFSFDNLSAENIGNLFSAFDLEVKVVIYIRPFVEYVVSFWNTEILKSATGLGLEEYIDLYHYEDELDQIYEYGRAFGNENIILRPFEREQLKNSDLMEDFLDCLGLELDDDFEIPDNTNESFDRSTLELLGMVNALKLDKYFRRKLYAGVIARRDRSQPKPIETLSDELIDGLSNKYRETERAVARDFLNREFLFMSTYPKCYGRERSSYCGLSSTQVQELLMDVARLAKAMYPALAEEGGGHFVRRMLKHLNKRRLLKAGGRNG